MAKKTYDKYVVQELKAPFTAEQAAQYAKFSKRILWIDKDVVPGAFQMNCSWYMKPIPGSPPPHTHPEDEILGFFGNDPDDPYNLHGEVEMWLGDQKFIITKTAMIFIPGGLKHCPLKLVRCDKPIFHFSVITGGKWGMDKLQETRKPNEDYSRNVVTELKTPANFKPEFVAEYKTFATRVLWMDKNVVPGAFQMNVSWYCKPKNHAPVAHKHEADEIIGFFGGDYKDPYNLNGEVEMWMEDQQFLLTKSTYLFAPAGMNHCPLIIRRADRPIFHFSIVTSGTYELKTAGK
jgi:mannose-6-phosphate isomerase-like protein (cupin superfamily)